MRRLLLLASIALLSFAGLGCANDQTEESTTPATNSSSTPPAQPDAPAAAASLGETQEIDHFAVSLATEPDPPKKGETKFIADVSHHGTPTSAAKVTLNLSMPEMGHGGPTVELTHVDGSRYEGTADLGMAGAWQAEVVIDEQGHIGTAIVKFDIAE